MLLVSGLALGSLGYIASIFMASQRNFNVFVAENLFKNIEYLLCGVRTGYVAHIQSWKVCLLKS